MGSVQDRLPFDRRQAPAGLPAPRREKRLLLPAAGYRNYTSGAVTNQGTNGNWWSSTPYNGSNGHNLNFNSNNVNPVNNSNSANGFSVRCVRSEFVALLLFFLLR